MGEVKRIKMGNLEKIDCFFEEIVVKTVIKVLLNRLVKGI